MPAVGGARFCAECGTSLSVDDADLAPPSTASGSDVAAVAERRLVSVVFADLVGFTTLAEKRDAEEVRELLTEYFDRTRLVIERYGGTVEKFIGDAVMAVWGTPVAHEDDAERAVRSALDLVDAVRAMGETGAAPGLQARAGVLTGEAAVTLGASNQGMVAGDLVNAAARLQSAAEPGTVLVGEGTQHATTHSIGYEPSGPHTLKGKSEPLTAYRAVRVLSKRRGSGRPDQLEAPFTGRQVELRTLKDFLHATGEEKRARLVSVMGQGGIGKSRLAWELLKYIDGLTESVYWHHGRCPAYGEGVSFWALGEMVRGRAGIVEGEPLDLAGKKLAAAVADFCPDEAEARWIESALRELLGLDGREDQPADRRQETLFAAWRTFFERIAERGTITLVFEDLHWADTGLIDFVEHLLEWSRYRPIYVVTLARPELLDRRPGWGAGRRNFTSLDLEPLDDDAMRELLAGLVPGLPPEVSERILDRAEGIPLYAVETIRMLLADGKIEPAGGAFRPVGDLTVLAVPETLHALVAARLDALSFGDRTLVQEVSVLGKTFTLQACAAVSGLKPADLEPRLHDLVRRELFVLDVDPRSPERGQYGFVQELLREVAYGTLARRDRRRLHLAAAEHFEEHGDDEIAGVLATHYLAAYRAGPEDPGGEVVAQQAVRSLRAAAGRASRLGSRVMALDYLEQALQITTDAGECLELHLAAGEAATRGTRYDSARSHLSAAVELTRSRGDRLAELRAIVMLNLTAIGLGHTESALEPLERAVEEFSDVQGTVENVMLLEALSRVYFRLGREDESLVWCERALRESERREMTEVTLDLLVTRATVLSTQGRLREAAATLIGARQVAATENLVGIELRALINLAFATSADDLRVGLHASVEGAEVALRVGHGGHLPYLAGNVAECAVCTGDWDVAETMLDRVLSLEPDEFASALLGAWRMVFAAYRGQPYREEMAAALSRVAMDDPQARASVPELAARVALAEGSLDEARRQSRTAFEEFSGNALTWSARIEGRAALWDGDADPIEGIVSAIAEQPGRVMAAIRSELVAGAAALAGDRDGAAIGFADALRRWRELELVFDGALCQVTMVATLGAEPGTADAADEARQTFERLGAVPFLARLDEALARSTSQMRSA
jgi:class 3 adenylate cyclase/tetratricopeptide (TPR) repeat protein